MHSEYNNSIRYSHSPSSPIITSPESMKWRQHTMTPKHGNGNKKDFFCVLEIFFDVNGSGYCVTTHINGNKFVIFSYQSTLFVIICGWRCKRITMIWMGLKSNGNLSKDPFDIITGISCCAIWQYHCSPDCYMFLWDFKFSLFLRGKRISSWISFCHGNALNRAVRCTGEQLVWENVRRYVIIIRSDSQSFWSFHIGLRFALITHQPITLRGHNRALLSTNYAKYSQANRAEQQWNQLTGKTKMVSQTEILLTLTDWLRYDKMMANTKKETKLIVVYSVW